jgi:hypothetical protein
MDDDQRPVLTPQKHILVEKQKTAPLGGAVVGYFERAIWGGNPWARRSNIHFNKSVVVWPRVLVGFLGRAPLVCKRPTQTYWSNTSTFYLLCCDRQTFLPAVDSLSILKRRFEKKLHQFARYLHLFGIYCVFPSMRSAPA